MCRLPRSPYAQHPENTDLFIRWEQSAVTELGWVTKRFFLIRFFMHRRRRIIWYKRQNKVKFGVCLGYCFGFVFLVANYKFSLPVSSSLWCDAQNPYLQTFTLTVCPSLFPWHTLLSKVARIKYSEEKISDRLWAKELNWIEAHSISARFQLTSWWMAHKSHPSATLKDQTE